MWHARFLRKDVGVRNSRSMGDLLVGERGQLCRWLMLAVQDGWCAVMMAACLNWSSHFQGVLLDNRALRLRGVHLVFCTVTKGSNRQLGSRFLFGWVAGPWLMSSAALVSCS